MKALLAFLESINARTLFKSIPPRWLHAWMAILIFAFFATIKPVGPNGSILLVIAIVAIYYSIRRQGIRVLQSKKRTRRIHLGLFVIITFYLFTVFLFRLQELTMAPYASGLVAALGYFLVSELRRRNARRAAENTRE
jgi:hypothetical protein